MQLHGTGLEDSLLFDFARLDRLPYRINTYNSKDELINTQETYWTVPDETSVFPFSFTEPKIVKAETIANKVKSIREMQYYSYSSGRGLPMKSISKTADGKQYVSYSDYCFRNNSTLEDANILGPVRSGWTIFDENQNYSYDVREVNG